MDRDHVMTEDDEKAQQVETLLSTPDLADALESEQFRHFLDQIPIAIVVAEMKGRERIIYANPEFEKVSGQLAAEVEGKPWSVVRGQGDGDHAERKLGVAIVDSTDFVGTFQIERAGREIGNRQRLFQCHRESERDTRLPTGRAGGRQRA